MDDVRFAFQFFKRY